METVELKKKILKLLREDEEFKLAVAGLLGYDTILNELKKLREDFQHFVREQERRWEENSKRWEEANRRFEVLESELRKLREDFNKFVELQEKRWEENNKRWEENNRRWEENNRRWEEEARRWEENNKRWEENNKRWEEAYKRFEAIEKKLLEHDEKFESVNKELKRLSKAVAELQLIVGSMGRRWGRDLEKMVLEIYRYALEERGIEPGKVEKFKYVDREGRYLGKGAVIEVDIYIHDDKVYLLEVKSRTELEDVEWFSRKVKIVEEIIGRKAEKYIIVTVHIDDDALMRAIELGLDVVYGSVIRLE